LILSKYSLTTIDFPTPVSPVNRTLNPPDNSLSIKNPNLIVSAVGTKILKKGIAELKVKSGIISFQFLNSFFSKSMK
jgi:hypothetical protein